MQNQFRVPSPNSPGGPNGNKNAADNFSNMIYRNNSNATLNEMNKSYQRWHEVLQEGLVPMTVHALGLLEKQESFQHAGSGADKKGAESMRDEEEAYFASLEGMEEEIQVMAILARAASLETDGGSDVTDNNVAEGDGMEKINTMMKCTAMLLFHSVLMASSSTPSSDSSDSTAASETINNDGDVSAPKVKAAAGYDGRVRHVMKKACVDQLTRAILESVESFDKKWNGRDDDGNADNDGEEYASPTKKQERTDVYNIDEYSLWDIAKIKVFLDVREIGKDAIFGTPWKPSLGTSAENVGGKKLMHKEQSSASLEKKKEQEQDEQQQSQSPQKEVNSADGAELVQTSLDAISDMKLSDSSNNLQNDQTEQVGGEVEGCISDSKIDDSSTENSQNYDGVKADNNSAHENMGAQQQLCVVTSESTPEQHEDPVYARRQFNAKFLATRKFELIERLIAIDVVRFLMAEEREQKLRQRDIKDRKNKLTKLPSLLRKDHEDEVEGDAQQNNGKNANTNQNPNDTSTSASNPELTKADRIKQFKRGLKIAGVSVTLGAVFAITGGLAAPALAAGIGGLAALTGAGTASSTAVLAVLATFKAGAALFGVGGGGIAAYKMKKRTAGLTEFEVRRENIQQYMYPGASEDRMKKGIEAMLPHLHTSLCVSGWLRDNDPDDFQLAWGIQPTCRDDNAKTDAYRMLQMRRFYSIYNPQLVHLCEEYLTHLKKVQGKRFSWERIFNQLERKYGASPEFMIPIDKPFDNEISLSHEEKEMIDNVLNDAKVAVGKQRGFLAIDEMDFNKTDEIADFLSKVSPVKKPMNKVTDAESSANAMENEMDMADAMKNELDTRLSEGDLTTIGSDTANESDQKTVSENENKSETCVGKYDKEVTDKRKEEENDKGKDEAATCQPSAAEDHESKEEKTHAEDGISDERCPIIWDWKRLYGTDIHTVTWESKMLKSLCHIVENMAMEVSTQATKVALQFSVVGAIIAAVALPSALLTASKLIDDPYQIVILRADEAGKELAKCLLQSDERRPVTLVGFSFGARVIFSCLRELARQQEIWEKDRLLKSDTIGETAHGMKRSSSMSSALDVQPQFEYDREPASLIADVIFIGLPRAIDKAALASCRRVTGGRFINCYIRNDWLLSLMFLARGGTQTCGTKPIENVPGVENYDVTNLVESHTKYGGKWMKWSRKIAHLYSIAVD